jgi:hypothetical protein
MNGRTAARSVANPGDFRKPTRWPSGELHEFAGHALADWSMKMGVRLHPRAVLATLISRVTAFAKLRATDLSESIFITESEPKPSRDGHHWSKLRDRRRRGRPDRRH